MKFPPTVFVVKLDGKTVKHRGPFTAAVIFVLIIDAVFVRCLWAHPDGFKPHRTLAFFFNWLSALWYLINWWKVQIIFLLESPAMSEIVTNTDVKNKKYYIWHKIWKCAFFSCKTVDTCSGNWLTDLFKFKVLKKLIKFRFPDSNTIAQFSLSKTLWLCFKIP